METRESLSGLSSRERYKKISQLEDKIQELNQILYKLEERGKIDLNSYTCPNYKGQINYVKNEHINRLYSFVEMGVSDLIWVKKFLHVQAVLGTIKKELNEF